MIHFTTTILKFGQLGEKTGWTYISIPGKIAQQIFPGNKKTLRVKGKLDQCSIKGIALMPMGEGSFIMPLNAALRKKIKKQKGASLEVAIELDKQLLKASPEFSECIAEEINAKKHFESLPMSHRNYFIRWIDGAKTDITKAKRIANAIDALAQNKGFAEMLRNMKIKKEQYLK